MTTNGMLIGAKEAMIGCAADPEALSAPQREFFFWQERESRFR